MIEINIDHQKFFVDNFPQKKSDLNKSKNKLTLQIPVYKKYYVKNLGKQLLTSRGYIDVTNSESKEVQFFKNLKELPKSIIFNKGNVYFWKLNGVKLIGIVVKSTNEYFEYDKTIIELTIGYEDVYGTHNLTLLNRTSKLDELLDT
jgi:hypothetical protein